MSPDWLFVAAGGAVGALLRYGVDVGATRMFGPEWPIGTAVVNIVGSLVLGLVIGLGPQAVPQSARLFFATGVLGAFTTFSTFSVNTIGLFERGDVGAAIANVLLNTTCGLLAAGLGLWLGRAVTRS